MDYKQSGTAIVRFRNEEERAKFLEKAPDACIYIPTSQADNSESVSRSINCISSLLPAESLSQNMIALPLEPISDVEAVKIIDIIK